MMTDLYGDGWDGARLYAEFPDGATGSDAPTCTEKTIVREICTDTSGLFYLTAVLEEERIPQNYWEIFWTVEVCGNNTNETTIYTGTYNTTMIFNYDDSTLEWSLVYYENVLPNTKECDACGDATQCKDDDKRPRPTRRRRSPKDDDRKGKPGNDDKGKRGNDDKGKRGNDDKGNRGNDDKGNQGNDDNTNTTRNDDDKNTTRRLAAGDNLHSPRPAATRVTMFDEQGDGWWLNNYLGSSWYLADSTRTQLFHTGTLCDGAKGYCNMCLGDGEYTMRFTGPSNSSFTSWDFCGVTGTYGEELIFQVENGQCIPIALFTVEQACDDLTITFTFESSFELCLQTEVLDLSDSSIVSILTQTLVDVMGADEAMIIVENEEGNDDDKNQTDTEGGGMSHPNRPKSSRDDDKKKKKSRPSVGSRHSKKDDDKEEEVVIFTHEIKFRITFTIHSDEFVNHELLEEQYEDLFQAKINGTFLPTLLALSAGVAPLNATSCFTSEGKEFELISYRFDNSLPFESSPLILSPGSAVHPQVVSSYDYSSITLFFGALLVGFVAFVGIIARGFNGYDRLGEDSDHAHLDASITSTHSRHGLMTGIEMDHTISNPLGRNAAQEADLTRVSQAL